MISSALYVASFAAGLPWGPLGVAVCYTAVGFIQAPFLWAVATRCGPVGFWHLVGAVLPCLAAAGAAALAVLGLQRLLAPGPVALAILLAAAYATFVAALVCAPRGRRILWDSLTEGRRLARSIAAAA